MWRKKHVALFNVCIGFLPGKKSLGKVSSSFSQFFFCCLHQGNPKKSAQFWKISLICPDPSSPNIMLEKKMTISFCKRIDINFEESFSTAAWFFNFPYQSRSTVDLLLKIVSVMIPDFFNFWAVLGGSLSYYPTNHPMWHSLRAPTSIFEQASIQKIQAFPWGLPGLGRTSEQNPRSPKIASWKRGRGYGVTSRGCWMGIDLATNSSFFFECCQSWGGWGFLNFSISPEIQVFLALIIL